jgi:hypothetical protein
MLKDTQLIVENEIELLQLQKLGFTNVTIVPNQTNEKFSKEKVSEMFEISPKFESLALGEFTFKTGVPNIIGYEKYINKLPKK